jgi:hypothetical protein
MSAGGPDPAGPPDPRPQPQPPPRWQVDAPPGDDRSARPREPQTAPPSPPPRPRRPRWLLPLIAAGIVTTLAVAATGVALATREERPDAAAQPAPTTAPAPSTTVPGRPSTVSVRIRQIERQLTEVRGLTFLRPVPSEVLSEPALARKLLAEVDEDTDEADLAQQARAYTLLGELPAGTDLVKLLREVRAESVLGFYVPGTGPDEGRLYARSDRGLTPFTEWTLAHELTHAVTDQRFDLTRLDRLDDQGLDDELFALLALTEGDATLASEHYVQSKLSPSEQAALASEALAQTTPRLDRAPAVIRESLYFPYQAGRAFVQALHVRGGWAAVDRAYRDPPTSTEQILHPEKYLGRRDAPERVRVPDLAAGLGSGWRAGTDFGFGEFDVAQLLNGELAVSAARDAAAGWDGGRVRTFTRGGATALVLRTVWDTAAEADEYCKTTARWANERLGAGAPAGSGGGRWSGRGQHAALLCSGSRAAWLSAPDAGTLERLVTGLGSP